LESGFSPHALTYITAVTALIVVSVLSLSLLLLCCSDYAVELSTYLRLTSHYLTTLLFTGVILTQYFTAAVPESGVNRYHILPSIGGCVLLCGSTFFLINCLLSTKIRSLVLCQGDHLKRKGHGRSGDFKSTRLDETTSTNSSNQSTPKSAHKNFFKKPATDPHANSEGIKVLLRGHPVRSTGMNPVPLSLFSNQGLQGRVRHSGDIGGMRANPGYRLDLTSSAV
jgi:hypothetical protein